jgi:hypothetical protein
VATSVPTLGLWKSILERRGKLAHIMPISALQIDDGSEHFRERLCDASI